LADFHPSPSASVLESARPTKHRPLETPSHYGYPRKKPDCDVPACLSTPVFAQKTSHLRLPVNPGLVVQPLHDLFLVCSLMQRPIQYLVRFVRVAPFAALQVFPLVCGHKWAQHGRGCALSTLTAPPIIALNGLEWP
jgi:hypothetical protein